MKSFSYTAKDAMGNASKGVISAETEQEFLEKIRDRGLFCTSHAEVSSSKSKSIHKFKTKELAFNCRQLSAMLSSGLTLVKALDILCREQPTEAAKAVWLDIYENVQKGESFSTSLTMQDGAFPQFLISMVNAGESSGSLDVIMQRMSDHYANENALNNKIKGALIYPIILGVLSVAVVILLFVFVLPALFDMFDPESMPALTKAMVAISNFLINQWYIMVGIVAVLAGAGLYMSRLPATKAKLDRFKLTGPGFGKLVVKIYTGRFARTLSSLYSSGIPMVECLQRASAVLNNSYISEKFEDVIAEVKQGEPLSASIQRTEIFESMFTSIIYVGEESGALDEILSRTAEYYEEEAESAVQRLVTMIEPIMIIFLGVVVGLIVASVLPALYSGFDDIG